MYFLYNIALWLALPFIVVYHLYRSVSRGRRPAFGERFGFGLPLLTGERTVWVHAVSVGETIAVKPLLKALKTAFPKCRIVLSNGTETGHSIAEKIAEVDRAIYFPFDYRFAVTRALGRVRPSLVVVVETEIWPNFLRAARKRGIPTLLVNGRISDRSFGRYLKLSWFFRPVLADVVAFCMQTAEDARRIVAIGAEPVRVHVARNLKYDIPAAPPSAERIRELRTACKIPDGVMVITAGSTHQGEEGAVLAAYRRLLAEGRSCFLVLVPRHPERAGEVAETVAGCGLPYTFRSGLDRLEREFRTGEVLLVDRVGELMKFYAISDLVFVGGSLVPTGGHNVLEPASLGVPVLVGPHMSNFREAAELLLANGAGLRVGDGEELAASLGLLLDDEARRRTMGEGGVRLLQANSGATARHMEVVRSLMRGEE